MANLESDYDAGARAGLKDDCSDLYSVFKKSKNFMLCPYTRGWMFGSRVHGERFIYPKRYMDFLYTGVVSGVD